jgi:hypothetical protein
LESDQDQQTVLSRFPTLAGLQQFMEGHVWMGLNNSDPSMIRWAAMGFIFFSWLIWPIWVPFSIYFHQPPANRRKLPLFEPATAKLFQGTHDPFELPGPHFTRESTESVALNCIRIRNLPALGGSLSSKYGASR